MSGDWWMRGMKVVSPDRRTRHGERAQSADVLRRVAHKHARSREGPCYVALLLEGMRRHDGQSRFAVSALKDEQMDTAMQGWLPAG
jgi:hypothetical protein